MKYLTFGIACALAGVISSPVTTRAADHGDGPRMGSDQGADLGDIYAFVDPNDSTRVVLISTVRGFIVPGEANNFASFDPLVQIAFGIETSGDEKPDLDIAVTFDPRVQASDRSFSQQAKIKIDGLKGEFTAPVTQPTLAGVPNAQIVTTLSNSKNPTTGIQFFAGEVDDPFFFDIPGFARFVNSVLAGTPVINETTLNRGRDTFSGYNILAVAFSFPKDLLSSGTSIGVSSTSSRPSLTKVSKKGLKGIGKFKQVDREGIPGVNAVIVPFNRKDEYNSSTTSDDVKGKFADDIVAVLTALGANVDSIGVLAGLAVANGDQLRLDTSLPNAGTGGGSGVNGFPNGRRLRDDVIDVVLNVVSNGAVTTGDSVNSNDVAFGDTFPFLAPPQQPWAAGTDEDNTRN